jgi:hypothetical protein
MICPTGEAKYFCKRGWTRLSTNRPMGKSLEQPCRQRFSNRARAAHCSTVAAGVPTTPQAIARCRPILEF